MNRSDGKIQQRQKFVREYVDNHKKPAEVAISELANTLFLSEQTIVKDLKAPYIDENAENK